MPGIVLEPKEKGGEVTLQPDKSVCIIIDVGFGNTVTINNTRVLLKGSDVPKMKQSKSKNDDLNKTGDRKIFATQRLNNNDSEDNRDSQYSGLGATLSKHGGKFVGLNKDGDVVKTHTCIEGFCHDNIDDIVCLILIKSGTLIL